jgi:hypothetical protein
LYVLYFAVVILEEFVLEEPVAPVACVARKATGQYVAEAQLSCNTITDNYSSTNRSLAPVVSRVVAGDPSTYFVNARSLEFTVDYVVDGGEVKR